MDISIVPVSRIFKTYQGQSRIAELNSKNPVKRVQGQRDQVSISKEARAALSSLAQENSVEKTGSEGPVAQAEGATA